MSCPAPPSIVVSLEHEVSFVLCTDICPDTVDSGLLPSYHSRMKLFLLFAHTCSIFSPEFGFSPLYSDQKPTFANCGEQPIKMLRFKVSIEVVGLRMIDFFRSLRNV